MRIEITKRAGLIAISVLIALGVIFGGYKVVKAYQANKTNVEALTAQVSDVTSQLEAKKGELITMTTDLESANEALTVIKEQYGVALTDKETAEQEASKQKKSAQSSANEANKQKGIATACADNLNSMANVVYYLDQQSSYYVSATSSVSNALNSYLSGYYASGNNYLDDAIGYMDYGNNLQSTIDYWLGQIK